MTAENSLFRLETDSDHLAQHAPLLHLSIDGFVDAGQVRSQIADHILDSLDHEVLASFDVDQLVDYRSRRPMMTFDSDHYSDIEQVSLVLYRVKDVQGQPFLFLHGSEPDYRWEAFTEAVHQLCRAFGVRKVVSAHGIPMAVPHTRPVGMTRFASDPDLIPGNQALFGKVQVPASVEALIQLRLGQAGLQTSGLATHVPHYLAESAFGDGAVAALDALGDMTELTIPMADLITSAADNRTQIQEQVDQAPEVRDAVVELEKRYDHFVEGQRRQSLLQAESEDLPSADELGAEFEELLKEAAGECDGDGEPGPASEST